MGTAALPKAVWPTIWVPSATRQAELCSIATGAQAHDRVPGTGRSRVRVPVHEPPVAALLPLDLFLQIQRVPLDHAGSSVAHGLVFV